MSDTAISLGTTISKPTNLAGFGAAKRKSSSKTPPAREAQQSEPGDETSTSRKDSSVDPNSAEDLLSAAGLGQRIKRLRLKRSMGLVELGKLTGLSASFLSQLETGRVVPTLRNLARISLVFGKDLSYFFSTENETVFRVQRKRDRVRLTMGATVPSYITESFGILIPEGGLRPCMAEFLAGSERETFLPERYPGVEMVYVLDGELDLTRNGEHHKLNKHDLMYISGESTRSYRCAGASSVQALIVSFDDETGAMRRIKK